MKVVVRGFVAGLLPLALVACSGGGSSPQPTPSDSSSSSACAAKSANYTSPPATLPALSVPLTTAAPPWGPPALTRPQQTAQYTEAAGLPCSAEMLQVHYHAHLDISVDGNPVVVPQYVGFVVQGNSVVGLAPLHTHDNAGIIHIENSVGPYCSGKGKELAVFVDGQRYTGDPTKLVLKMHQEIAIEYGPTGKLPTPPSSYAFPAGL
jgi:hypothetical protein